MATRDHTRSATIGLVIVCDPVPLCSAMNLPNSLTLARIVLVPLLVVVLLTSFQGHLVLGLPKGMAAALIFGVASLTDWLDGYLARRRKQITVLGQLLDPIADKLLTTAAFVSLVQLDMVAGVDRGGDHRPRAGGDGPARRRPDPRPDRCRPRAWAS